MTWKARVKFRTLGLSKLRARTRHCGQDWPLACSPRPSLCSWLCPHLEGLTGTCVDTRSSCPHAITFLSSQCWLGTPLASLAQEDGPKKDAQETDLGSPEQDRWGSQELGVGSRHRI